MLFDLLIVAVLALAALPFLAVGRFKFPKFDDESYPAFIADTFDKRTLVQGGVILDASEWSENAEGYKYAQAGTIVGRSSSEVDNDAPFGQVDGDDRLASNQEEMFLLAHDVQYLRENPAGAILRHGTQIRMDKLPGYGSFSSDQRAFVEDNHDIVPGTK